MLSLLAQGNTGSEILQILDTLTEGMNDNTEEGEIQFWLILTVGALVVRQSVSDVDTGAPLCYDAW